MEGQITNLERSFMKLKASVRIMTRKLHKLMKENEKALIYLKSFDSKEFASNASIVRILSDLQLSTRQRIIQINFDNNLFFAGQMDRILTKLQNIYKNSNRRVENCNSIMCNNYETGTTEVETSSTVDELCEKLSKTHIAFKITTKKGNTSTPLDTQKKFEYSTSEDDTGNIGEQLRNNRRYFAQNGKRPFNTVIEKDLKSSSSSIPSNFNTRQKPVTLATDALVEPKLNDFCTITYYLGPDHFYINLLNDKIQILEKLTQNLNKYATSTNPFRSKTEATLSLGSKCVAYSEIYQNWYRANVIDWMKDSTNEISVQLMDYGDFENVNFAKLRIIRPSDLEYDSFALKCYLSKNALDIGKKWSEDDEEVFCGFMGTLPRNYFRIKYKCKMQDCLAIDLVNVKYDYSEGTQTLADIIMNSKKLPPKEDTGLPPKEDTVVFKLRRPKPDKVLKCASLPVKGQVIKLYVTGFEAVNVFYGRVKSNNTSTNGVSALKKLLKAMNGNGNQYVKYKHPPKNGTVVIAKRNNNFFRAVIECVVLRHSVRVSFVDYGQVETLPLRDIYEIPDEYLILPKQAIKCTIGNIIPLNKSNIYRVLEELDTIYLASTLTAEVLETGSDHIEVKVFFQDRDIGMDFVQRGMAELKEYLKE